MWAWFPPLVGRKRRQIQAAKLHRKKLLRPFPVSERVGTAKYPALKELQFLEGPPPGGFSFLGHRISFEQL
jgi:hypothetical protein